MDYIVKIEDNHWKCTLFSQVVGNRTLNFK